MNTTSNEISFSDFFEPGLAPGSYTITAQQTIGNQEIGTLKQQFNVSGPQFTLGPKDIHTQYPADGTTDDCEHYLPYVVLSRRTLPWERKLAVAGVSEPVPWMALLVLAEEEVSPTLSMTIDEYLNPERKIGDEVMHADTLVSPAALDSGVDRTSYCQCIELACETFLKVVPTPAELPYLAHNRTVSMQQKAEVDMPHQGVFAIVLANRLPLKNVKNIVHLVSLEGYPEYLTKGNDVRKIVRLVSLANWSFYCDAGSDSFAAMVENLVQKNDSEQRLLRLPYTGKATALKARLEEGYVPLPYHLMDGTESFAWYRGPLSPVRLSSPNSNTSYRSASSALAFDQPTGIFDQTRAAAWQLGRLLALADPAFGPKLIDLRRKFHQTLDRFFEQFSTQSGGAEVFAGAASADDPVAALLDADALDYLESALTENTANTLLGNLVKQEEESNSLFATATAVASAISTLSMDDYVTQFSGFLTMLGAEEGALSAGEDASSAASNIDHQKLVVHLLQKFSEELRPIASWLNQLSVAHIPFHYIVPHPHQLPPETLRFFHVDAAWWYAVYDGALSLGVHSSVDEAIWKIISQHFTDPVKREKLAAQLQLTWNENSNKWGVLLRSRLVKAWAGVEFLAYDKNQQPVSPEIRKRVGSDTLLFLFNQKPSELQIQMPREGLRFVIKDENPLRHPAGEGLGTFSEKKLKLDFRDKSNVLNVSRLVDSMEKLLGVTLKSSAFALQLIDSPDRFILKVKPEGEAPAAVS